MKFDNFDISGAFFEYFIISKIGWYFAFKLYKIDFGFFGIGIGESDEITRIVVIGSGSKVLNIREDNFVGFGFFCEFVII